MISRHYVRSLIGQQVQCHTHYGVFHGVVAHCTKHHLILIPSYAAESTPAAAGVGDHRWGPWGYGPGGPAGPGGPGPGGYGPGPGGGGGWQIAIPLAAIIGVTAIGMHWW
ncbi:hypothetical protein JI721_02100 [Alicyclobacillus cycloheptanicus]|uniref:Membrane protein n=1 Tax=Alicyclobacillus cycloheptanicus TaxID=1457 RepID=A0ABT9XGP5_9BACL|nr:hypothetical protein [Alicyclobacillus cycloheptanicus]MDQ0188988.1 putative membrane protein [Alicyclobacillus cycloheptanicus]WDM01669.1 hypothetical protein JI721_02100 [Alicyclobacillus cycloheptanicus]